jgi:hypothetical protein
VVILEIDIDGVLAIESKREPQIPGHGDRPTLFLPTTQRMKPPARDIHVPWPARSIEPIQHPFDASSMFGRDAARHAGHEQPLETFVVKAADHGVTPKA